ncbi:MAG: hypothetical protein IJV00_07425 [Clostridia bacterium]|nr:hypothetical protein [Clostridia bacterium]
MGSLEKAAILLPPELSRAVLCFSRPENVREIRLRRSQPLSISVGADNLFINSSGQVTAPSNGMICTEKDLEAVLSAACAGSLYRYEDQLRQGFVTTPLGVRLGLSGRVTGDGSVAELGGINLRVPSSLSGVSREAIDRFKKGGLCPTLFFSPPGGGKTTFMRDLAISLARGALGSPLRVCAADERDELFPDTVRIPPLLDVIRACPKSEAICRAVSLLSPQVIVCDELYRPADCDAVREYSGCGAVLIASCHAGDVKDLGRRPGIASLIKSGCFDLLGSLVLSERLRVEFFPPEDAL